MKYFNKLLRAISNWPAQRVEIFGAPYTTFALFSLFNYPAAFLFLYYFESQEEESFGLRAIACMLAIPLLFHRYYPQKIKQYLPLYWHVSVLYSIPFFATVMLYRNNFSLEWLLNMLLGIFLFILLVDWLSFLVLLTLGLVLGTLFFYMTGGIIKPVHVDSNITASGPMILYLYFYAIIIGVLFARNREKINEEKLLTVKSIAYAIAHEMRTPLAAISAGASNLRKFQPIFDDAYQKAEEAGLELTPINNRTREQLKEIPLVMEKVSYNAQNVINMLLMKVKDSQVLKLEPCSLSLCIQSALEQYPLSEHEKEIIHWDKTNDFIFLGKEEMFLHIFFNLIKNSLYQIASVKDGNIRIWSVQAKENNYLYFKDNGRGISKKILPKIFDRFVSGNDLGSGMGLAYCKMAMNSFGGDIKCSSEEGNGAEFKLIFPKI
jgi:signal transduction histidine kinase